MPYGRSSASENNGDKRTVLTVFELNEYIRMLLEGNPVLKSVWVKGEISNFVSHRSGHLYFSLKDEDGVIRAVMFRGQAESLGFLPEEGMKVILHGRVTLYGKTGQYQITADAMQPDGVGALYIAFEQLKRKLEREGLFAEERKKPLPRYPHRIGVITSPTGAAIRDMLQITARRYPLAEILLYPSLVQGADAPIQLISGLKYFEAQKETEDAVDVIIIGRGGGSIEDLWAFNDERLARTVAASTIPVISAVGHETDFTICDFVSDKRAPTPSAAAELAVPDAATLMRQLGNLSRRFETLLISDIERKRARVYEMQTSRGLLRPSHAIDEKRIMLDRLSDRLETASQRAAERRAAELRLIAERLNALNPLAILSRGYCAVARPDGTICTKAESLSENDVVLLRFSDAEKRARIEGDP